MLFTQKPYKVRKREEETPRINALKKRFLEDKFYVDVQRARLVTQSYKESEGQPMVIRRALAFKAVMEGLDCAIRPGELIVGSQSGVTNRSCSVFPESRVNFIREEIDDFETRATDRFIVTPEVKKELLEDIIPYWEDKCLYSNMLKALPDETRRHQLAENQVINGWCAFGNGPGHYVPDHENLLKMGLKGKREQAEKVLASLDMCDKDGVQKMNDLKAMIITIDAAIAFAHRYAAKAREMAAEETDEKRKDVYKRQGMYRDVSFELRRGEILGFSGLVGAGRTEVAMSVFGAIKPDAGTILIDGKEVKIRSPYDAIKHKLAYLPEDRKLLGVDLNSKIRNNISVTNMDKIANKGGFLNFKKEEEICTNAVKQLRIKTPSIMQLVGNLSGGNQQKVAIAKWITRDIDVLILDEPTRGVDVGAKEEIHKMIVELARQGIGIVLISSELPEVLGMSDRVVVMHEGEIKAMLNAQEATQELVMSYSVGSEEKVQGGIC